MNSSYAVGARIAAAAKVLYRPSQRNFELIAKFAEGAWWHGALMIASVFTVGILLASSLAGIPNGPVMIVDWVVTLLVLAIAWAASAQFIYSYVGETTQNIFEPLLYFAGSSLVVLLVLMLPAGMLPSPAGTVFSLLIALYSQFLVVLAVKQFGRVSIVRSAIVTVGAGLSALIVSFMVWSMVFGLQGMLEG